MITQIHTYLKKCGTDILACIVPIERPLYITSSYTYHFVEKAILFLIGISPIQRPHYITSSYTYQFLKKVILVSF